MYVTKLNPDAKEVVVGPKSALNKTIAFLKEVNWLEPPKSEKEEKRLTVKVRSSSAGFPATVSARRNNTAEVFFETSPGAIAPGQAAVFYDGTRLMGGGWIYQ